MILPSGAAPEARLLLFRRGLRAFADGHVAVLLPAHLALGFGTGTSLIADTDFCMMAFHEDHAGS